MSDMTLAEAIAYLQRQLAEAEHVSDSYRIDACNQSRLAFAGRVSVDKAIAEVKQLCNYIDNLEYAKFIKENIEKQDG